MHCVCIGIMKKLLLLWTGKSKTSCTLPANLINGVNNNIIRLAQHIPKEFQKTPHENGIMALYNRLIFHHHFSISCL